MDASDWSRTLRYHNFDTRPGHKTKIKVNFRVPEPFLVGRSRTISTMLNVIVIGPSHPRQRQQTDLPVVGSHIFGRGVTVRPPGHPVEPVHNRQQCRANAAGPAPPAGAPVWRCAWRWRYTPHTSPRRTAAIPWRAAMWATQCQAGAFILSSHGRGPPLSGPGQPDATKSVSSSGTRALPRARQAGGHHRRQPRPPHLRDDGAVRGVQPRHRP